MFQYIYIVYSHVHFFIHFIHLLFDHHYSLNYYILVSLLLVELLELEE